MKSREVIACTEDKVWHVTHGQAVKLRNGKLERIKVNYFNQVWIGNTHFDIYKNNKLMHPLNHDLDIIEIYNVIPVSRFSARLELLFKITDKNE